MLISYGGKKAIFMSFCWWVLVLVFPMWREVRCLRPFGARRVLIKNCKWDIFCWRRKYYYILFVLWYPPLPLYIVWLSCWLLRWLCTQDFFWQFPCRGHVSLSLQLHWFLVCVLLRRVSIFCCDLLWFEICYLYNCSWLL